MDREVVVVSINYRLGALGFLATGTKESPGNAGMKDQALALKWVQKNIAHFGGDPNKVTISGHSAGAHAVTAHMISPLSKGLFHRVIAMSGSIASARPLLSEYFDLAKKLGEKLGCATEVVADLVKCLKEVFINLCIVVENLLSIN